MRKQTIFSISATIATLFQTGLLLTLIMAAPSANSAEKTQIKIEQFSLNRSVAYLGEEVIASVSISATPALRKEALRVRYYLDKKLIGTQSISDFDQTGIAKTVFSFKDASKGRFQFRVVADNESKSGKSDEVSRQLAILSLPGGMSTQQFSNTSDDKAPTNEPGSGKPDLSPVSIDFSIAAPRLGQKIRIVSRITNTGSIQADNAKIRLFINGQPYGKDITMNIAAGSEASIETDFLPASEGKKDILLLINPDGEIDEKSNRNNLLSKTLIVRPAKQTRKNKKLAEAPRKNSTQTSQTNLVVYIETISGVHYTANEQVQFYITNNSPSEKAKPSMMGIQLLQASTGKIWLVRKPVKALMPGETVTISVNWPKDQLSTGQLYIATVDIDGKNNETDVRDNHTSPFSVISTAAITVTPAATRNIAVKTQQNEVARAGKNVEIKWNSIGYSGERVRITARKRESGEVVLSSITNNDGSYYLDTSPLSAGKYSLDITSEDKKIIISKSTIQIKRTAAKIVKQRTKSKNLIPALSSPIAGSSYRGEQEIKISWPVNKSNDNKQLNLILLESSSNKAVTLNRKPVAAKQGQYTWQVPDDGSIFGIYTLQLVSLDGEVMAATKGLELLPNFVNFDLPEADNTKTEIQTDVEIARTSFNGPNLEFLVMNNGPADITPSGMVGYKFTTYFVRNIPIVKEDDLVICTSSLLTELPEGEGKIISLGRDPDCPLGERSSGARFVYAVSRFTLPVLANQRVKDPRPENNFSKFYWPD
ncbi:MAG: hypothetical protein KAJ95_09225 [Gammaproteobacteria bacterium]|nr:hypothetical protein [Gammaproteobacteria bacterium]